MTKITLPEYAVQRARELIAEAESGELDTAPASVLAMWVGAATATLRELTRDA